MNIRTYFAFSAPKNDDREKFYNLMHSKF